MNKEQIKNMKNSELLAHLFNSRDNLILIRRKMYDNPHTDGLIELFDLEREQYDELTKEVYRRMRKWKRIKWDSALRKLNL